MHAQDKVDLRRPRDVETSHADIDNLEGILLRTLRSGSFSQEEATNYDNLLAKLVRDAVVDGRDAARMIHDYHLPARLEDALNSPPSSPSLRPRSTDAEVSRIMTRIREKMNASGPSSAPLRQPPETLQQPSVAPDKFAPSKSMSWTGISSRKERLVAVRSLLPIAQSAVETLIEELGKPGDNGGPLLDERAEGLMALRELHKNLGLLISAVEAGRFEDDLGEELAAETVRYARRAGDALKNDPMPFAVSGLVFTLLAVCGMPDVGGFLSGAALAIQKRGSR
jgi:hypothetical protein